MFNFILDLEKGLLPLPTPDLVEGNEDKQSEIDANSKDLKCKTLLLRKATLDGSAKKYSTF